MTEYYLCVLDFEATCWENSENKDQMEIIEFPSVLYKINELENTCTFISEFAEYVKPTIKPILSKFCTELTGIEQHTVNSADQFEQVYLRHIAWLDANVSASIDSQNKSKFIFATCGNWDLNTQLPRELANKKLKSNTYYNKWINVKYEFEHFYKAKAGGMVGMLKFLNIKLIGKHHSGIDDTRNIAKIMLKMIADGHNYNNFHFITKK